MKDWYALTDMTESEREVGVGPYPRPWPDDRRLDPALLENGDRRNVVDRYRYWRHEAIVEDLDSRRFDYHVAIENWQHDFNIGAIVRNANAFMAREVHIIGRRSWNRRGAMVTERYQHVRHHDGIGSFVDWARAENLPILGIDNLPGAAAIFDAEIPRACVMLFGQEGPGLSEDARAAADGMLAIPQFGSTRSINAGAASAIAMAEWIRRYGLDQRQVDR
jgi:tRNA G18 (ribose-2'-O)-methylase SpoU